MDEPNTRNEATRNEDRPWVYLGEYQQDEQAVQYLQQQVIRLESKIDAIDQKLNKLIESTRAIVAWHRSMAERDQRDLNYNLRGYVAKNAPAVNFVPAHSGNIP